MRWPDDALHEVAVKFISDMEMDEQYIEGIAAMCAYSHSTSVDASLKMQLQLKRIFYVTPTNYIELLKGYRIIVE
jgi:dynein heavy chain